MGKDRAIYNAIIPNIQGEERGVLQFNKLSRAY